MPKYVDDYVYSFNAKDWFDAQGIRGIECGWGILTEGIPWEAIKATETYHLTTDNARIGTILMPFLVLLPKWISSLWALLMWIVCVFCSYRIIGVGIWSARGSKDFLVICIGMVLWTFGMPWSQFMGSIAFQYNYVVPSGYMMGLMWYVLFHDVKTPVLILLFLISCLIGACQEGMTIPVLVGSGVLIICNSKYRSPKYLATFLGLLAGVLFLVLMPAATDRMSRDLFRGNLGYTLVGQPAFILFGILLIIRCIRMQSLRIGDLLMFALVSGVVSIMLQIVTTGERRVGWWADLMSVIGIMRMFKQSDDFDKWVEIFISVVLVSLTIVHWVIVDVYTVKVRKIYDEVLAKHLYENSSTVFADFPTYYDMPRICMGHPDAAILLGPHPMSYLNKYYHGDNREQYLKLIPAELRYISSLYGSPVPGNTGIRKVGESYFLPEKVSYAEERIYHVTLDNGIETDCKFILYPFRSEGDGRTYAYCYPWHGNWKMLTGDIMKIEN